MKARIVYLSIFCFTPYFSYLNSFTLFNNSDSKKHIEVTTFLPIPGTTNRKKEIIFKTNLNVNEKIEAPFLLKDVFLDITWGTEEISNPLATVWKPIDNDPKSAQKWQRIGSTTCGDDGTFCYVVIPQTWQSEEDKATEEITITTDTGKLIKYSSEEDLKKKIPYRQMTKTIRQERLKESDRLKIQRNWKTVGSDAFQGKRTAIVIPMSWSTKNTEEDFIITKENGEEIAIPLREVVEYDPKKNEDFYYLEPDSTELREVIPFRYSNGIVTELYHEQANFIIEESPEKPLKMSQYEIMRHFTPQNAHSTANKPGVPEYIGPDHIFEISGKNYHTDITLVYSPEEKNSPTQEKIDDQLEPENHSNETHKDGTSQSTRRLPLRKSKTLQNLSR